MSELLIHALGMTDTEYAALIAKGYEPVLEHQLISYCTCYQANKIVDPSPLSRLTNLTYLALNDNQITRFDSLSSLKNLQELTIWNNAKLPSTCPVQPNSICRFEIPINPS